MDVSCEVPVLLFNTTGGRTLERHLRASAADYVVRWRAHKAARDRKNSAVTNLSSAMATISGRCTDFVPVSASITWRWRKRARSLGADQHGVNLPLRQKVSQPRAVSDSTFGIKTASSPRYRPRKGPISATIMSMDRDDERSAALASLARRSSSGY